MRPGEAVRGVRTAVEGPDPAAIPAVAAGVLLVASGLHGTVWPDLPRAEASRRTLRSVAALGAVGAPIAAAAAAVSDSLTSLAATLAFPG
ncbi:hypothetical protein [Streptomyces sp. NPDC046161]|uniref:hypothetical protein n=1 Tax=Streptomyces sp. NPDC046161 TaxID=3155132 RepID=UPI0033C460D5